MELHAERHSKVPLCSPLGCVDGVQGKAKEMVLLAERMRAKLSGGPAAQSDLDDEDAGSKQDMQDWLLSVGIASPVTKESAGALYHQQLSRQVVFLSSARAPGINPLSEVSPTAHLMPSLQTI